MSFYFEMNEWQQTIIDSAIRNLSDDRYRAFLTKQRDPNWRSGNGESIDEVIAQYDLQIKRLRGEQ